MKQGDKVKWIDNLSTRTKTGVIVEVTKTVSRSNEIKNMDDPYEPVTFKDVDIPAYHVKCDQDGKNYGFDEDELEKFEFTVVRSN